MLVSTAFWISLPAIPMSGVSTTTHIGVGILENMFPIRERKFIRSFAKD
jgi:TRAP-type C4-dicarboxylate transport system permease small subunit